MNQHTLSRKYTFEGKGLHTGKYAHMTLCPAPVDTGIRFVRTDLGNDAVVEALAENISNTARSTTISCGDVSVVTIEHLMSALTGLGVDNAVIEIDNAEVPILDGSAKYYCEAICADGLEDQGEPRRYITVPQAIEIKDEKSGSYVRILPADETSLDITVDFGSKVLGVQHAHFQEGDDYAGQIGSCRTFVFFHEIEYLYSMGLVKGGDVQNAIVIVEHPASKDQVDRLAALFGVPALEVHDGYLNNLQLHFPDECGRHKLLDLIGDMRLAGGYLKARIEAYKPGHSINAQATKALRQLLQNQK